MPHCDYSLQDQLTQHARKHTGARPYACHHPHCGKAFARRANLVQHLVGHQPQAQSHAELFACRFCGCSFEGLSSVVRHESTHLERAEPTSDEGNGSSGSLDHSKASGSPAAQSRSQGVTGQNPADTPATTVHSTRGSGKAMLSTTSNLAAPLCTAQPAAYAASQAQAPAPMIASALLAGYPGLASGFPFQGQFPLGAATFPGMQVPNGSLSLQQSYQMQQMQQQQYFSLLSQQSQALQQQQASVQFQLAALSSTLLPTTITSTSS